MNKFTLLAMAVGLVGLSGLSGCNSSDKAQEVTPRADTSITPTGPLALRNMATDVGNTVLSSDAVDVPAGEGISNLIDGDPTSKFLSFAPSATVLFTADIPYIIKGYNLISANDQPKRDPALWTLEASTDGNNWVELDSQNGQTFAGRAAKNQYDLSSNEVAYRYYRFSFTHFSTDDFNADILQIGELELMVKSDKPVVAFKTDKSRAEVGEAVIFLDQSLANPTSWVWTFEGGTPATSTEQHPTVTFATPGPKTVTLEATNDKGSNTLQKEQQLWVWDPANPWAGFPLPQVTQVKTDPTHAGQVAFDRVIPELTEHIHQVSQGVAKMLYHNVTEIPLFKTVTFETGHYDFPAAKGGNDTDMLLMMDLDHLANMAANGDEALRDEVLGMLWHELTHGYSGAPQTGQYQVGDEYHTFLESVADFVRIEAGYNEHKRSGVKWVTDWNTDAYNQTSFFLEWVANSHKSIAFIKLFIQQAAEQPEWRFDAAFKAILGDNRGVQVLWDEYQHEYLQNALGLQPPFPTPVEGFRNFAVDEGVVVSVNATDIDFWGEGVDKLIDNNVSVKFNAVIEQPWWFPADLTINDVDNVAVVIELPQDQLLQKYSLTTGNDNPTRDPSFWTVEGSADAENWTVLSEGQYPANPQRLTTYHYDVDDHQTAYRFYQFTFENTQQGEGVGGDNGRLVQIGELALLTGE